MKIQFDMDPYELGQTASLYLGTGEMELRGTSRHPHKDVVAATEELLSLPSRAEDG